ncbi:cupredoxin domain-containing protein [Streptomyces olivaceoviridis]
MSSAHQCRRAAALMVATAAALSLATAYSSASENFVSAAPSSLAAPVLSPGVGAAHITIKGFSYSPAKLTVKAGQKVTVVNEDSAAHTVTATQGRAFDTGRIAGGKSGSFTAPSKKGSYAFVCTYHPDMKGTLTVR